MSNVLNQYTTITRSAFKNDFVGTARSSDMVKVNGATTQRQGSETLLYSGNYLYDGWNLTAIIRQGAAATTHTLSQTFIWGPDLSSTTQGAGGVGGLLMIVNATTSKIHFPAYDANGNIMALLRADTGTSATIDAAYEYDPFGRTLRSTGPYASVNPFRFSTKFTDDETGLVYYGYRYLDVGLGRWHGRDPIEERGGVNLFGMVANCATCSTDMLGLETSTIVVKSFINGVPTVGNWTDGLADGSNWRLDNFALAMGRGVTAS